MSDHMEHYCFFCKLEPADRQCEICKRWVCIQCSDCHNCYPREGEQPNPLDDE